MSNVKFVDHSKEVKAMMNGKIQEALQRIGLAWEKNVKNVMQSQYGKPVVDTGRLINSMEFDVDVAKKTVTMGPGTHHNVEYAIFVHEGTSKMAGRPFLRDSIMNYMDEYQKIVESVLGAGWSVTASVSASY